MSIIESETALLSPNVFTLPYLMVTIVLNNVLEKALIRPNIYIVFVFCRRNDILLNKQSPDQKGGTVVVAVEDEKNRKFSTTVAEYGKV